jgi:hypothetical protein
VGGDEGRALRAVDQIAQQSDHLLVATRCCWPPESSAGL